MGSTVHLNVFDHEVVRIQALKGKVKYVNNKRGSLKKDSAHLVFGVGLCVLEEVKEKLCRLLGPATLRGAVNLGLE